MSTLLRVALHAARGSATALEMAVGREGYDLPPDLIEEMRAELEAMTERLIDLRVRLEDAHPSAAELLAAVRYRTNRAPKNG